MCSTFRVIHLRPSYQPALNVVFPEQLPVQFLSKGPCVCDPFISSHHHSKRTVTHWFSGRHASNRRPLLYFWATNSVPKRSSSLSGSPLSSIFISPTSPRPIYIAGDQMTWTTEKSFLGSFRLLESIDNSERFYFSTFSFIRVGHSYSLFAVGHSRSWTRAYSSLLTSRAIIPMPFTRA
jgi:hypothetical protein